MKAKILMLSGGLVVLVLAVLGLQFVYDPGSKIASVPVADLNAQIARGAYLAHAGDCAVCHTVRGGKPYAGGRAIATQYGTFYTPNVTPDRLTGIGTWSSDDFWLAMHNGKSKDGKFLYPAFPFTDYTKIVRPDSDALFAYFKSLEPVSQTNREHDLHFPFNQRILLAGWRTLYFRPGIYESDPAQSVQWNRGAYLVQGLGHCNDCHTSRNSLGAGDRKRELDGGQMPQQSWYAPSLTSDAEAGLARWEEADIAALLKTGTSTHGAVFGPMAEVVSESMQHLDDADINAVAAYLKTLPQQQSSEAPDGIDDTPELRKTLAFGARLYEKHCRDCHQANGRGNGSVYPPLAGNHALTTRSSVNVIRMVLNGGYAPSTQGNPRPFGMPPFGPALNDAEVAALVTYVRCSWGNQAGPVTPAEVARYRGVPPE